MVRYQNPAFWEEDFHCYRAEYKSHEIRQNLAIHLRPQHEEILDFLLCNPNQFFKTARLMQRFFKKKVSYVRLPNPKNNPIKKLGSSPIQTDLMAVAKDLKLFTHKTIADEGLANLHTAISQIRKALAHTRYQVWAGHNRDGDAIIYGVFEVPLGLSDKQIKHLKQAATITYIENSNWSYTFPRP